MANSEKNQWRHCSEIDSQPQTRYWPDDISHFSPQLPRSATTSFAKRYQRRLDLQTTATLYRAVERELPKLRSGGHWGVEQKEKILGMAGQPSAPCIFCQIASKSTSTTLLHGDDKVVAFQDISPSAVRHYLVIPLEHIPTVKDLQRRNEDYSLVNHMLEVGQMLLRRDAPDSPQHRFGFHQPPLNSINHLHLHCLALPYTPGWKRIKFLSLGSLGFLEAEKLLERLRPLPPVISKV